MPVELNITESVTELDTTVVTVTLESASEPGPAGPGVAPGGTAGQVLTKDSGTDYDTSWQDPTGGGGGAPDDATYIVQTAHGDLSAEQALSALSTGLVKVTTGTGVLSTATGGTDYANATHAHAGEDITSGTVADARIASTIARDSEVTAAVSAHEADTTNVHGIADTSALLDTSDIGSTVQAFDADLSTYAGITPSANVQSLLGAANYAAMRTQLDLEAGTDFPSLSTFNDHSARHENGGADEISIAGLDGTPTELTNHLNDASDAHDASAISVADSGGNFTGTDVEAVLAELQDNIDGVSGGSTDGWIADATTWTYASASTFTVSGDVTARFSKGTRLKLTQTTVKYAVVVNSNHAAGTTTVTIAVNTDYTLANAAITDTYYSYDVNPQGYPASFSYTPAWTSSGTQPAIVNGTITGSFSIVGNMCDVKVNISMGGSTTYGTGTYTISYPVTEVTGGVEANGMCLLFDSSTSGFYPAQWRAGSLLQLATVPSSFASNTAPFTWASSDQMQLSNRYRF